jgi:hypothetical protein
VTSPLIRPGEPFETHEFADLVVDRVYRGGPQPNWAADPLGRLLPVGLQGGIRVSGGQQAPRLVALATSGANADWPDSIETSTGTVTYYGDNRHPGSELHDTPKGGNRVLRATFDWAHADADTRRNVPPYFLFAKACPGRDIVFRGVLAPGAPELTADEDLVAVWRSQHGLRFQNYRAQFTILDVATATRAWIKDILAGDPLSANCPGPWRRWITGRHYQALTSTRIEYRSKSEQLPADTAGLQIITCIRAHFASQPSRFEAFAAHLWQMADGHVSSYEVTRASVDGGRDAVGDSSMNRRGFWPSWDRPHSVAPVRSRDRRRRAMTCRNRLPGQGAPSAAFHCWVEPDTRPNSLVGSSSGRLGSSDCGQPPPLCAR